MALVYQDMLEMKEMETHTAHVCNMKSKIIGMELVTERGGLLLVVQNALRHQIAQLSIVTPARLWKTHAGLVSKGIWEWQDSAMILVMVSGFMFITTSLYTK